MFKKLVIGLLAISFVILAVNQVSAAVCRTYPYCTTYPKCVGLDASVVTKFANKENVGISIYVFSPEDIPPSVVPPEGWVDTGIPMKTDSLSVCRNPGTNGWTAPGVNPPPTNLSFSGLSILYYIPKNGKTIATVNGITEQPINITDYCPNPNWEIDSVPEYYKYAHIQEIIIRTDEQGNKICYQASDARLTECFVNLNNVYWDGETLGFKGPDYECVGTEELTENKDPFAVDEETGEPLYIIPCPDFPEQ